MTIRRLLIGTTMVFGLCVWSWARPGTDQNPAHAASPVYAVEQAADAPAGGTHDEAAARFRSNQPRHWRHVMIGQR